MIRSFIRDFLFLLGDERQRLPYILVLFFFLAILDLVGLGLIGPFLALVVDSETSVASRFGLDEILSVPDMSSRELILVIGLLLVFLSFFKAVASARMAWQVIAFSQNQQLRLRSTLLQSYQNMSYEDYIGRNSNECINAIQFLVPNFAVLVMLLLQHAGEIILAILIFILLIYASPLAFFLVLFLLCLSILGYHMVVKGRMREIGRQSNDAAGKIIRYTGEAMSGLNEIRLLGKKAFFHHRLSMAASAYGDYQTQHHFFTLLPKYIFEVVIILFVVGIAAFSIMFGHKTDQLVFTLGIYGVAAVRLLPVARNFSSLLNRVYFHKDTVFRLAEDLRKIADLPETPGDIRSASPPKKARADSPYLAVKNLSFGHKSTDEVVLKHIDLVIERGQAVGIIGASGAGKTTLVNLILGLLKPGSGDIRVEGRSIHDDIEGWWRHIAYIPQDLFFIDGTLAENIALGEHPEEIDRQRMERAIAMTHLEPVIERLKDGLDTPLGENAEILSGGQRQRVAIARALYFDRDVLVFDEITSALDMKAEKRIIDHIRDLKGRITVIYIAHRKSTLRHCDHVYQIEGGRIAKSR